MFEHIGYFLVDFHIKVQSVRDCRVVGRRSLYIYFCVFRSNFDSVRNCRLFNISDYTLYRNILLNPWVLSSMFDLRVVHTNVNMYIDSVFCR